MVWIGCLFRSACEHGRSLLDVVSGVEMRRRVTEEGDGERTGALSNASDPFRFGIIAPLAISLISEGYIPSPYRTWFFHFHTFSLASDEFLCGCDNSELYKALFC